MCKSSCRDTLAKAQRCASLGIAGSIHSRSQTALDITLYLLPIEKYVEGVEARCAIRIVELALLRQRQYGHNRVVKECYFQKHYTVVTDGSKLDVGNRQNGVYIEEGNILKSYFRQKFWR